MPILFRTAFVAVLLVVGSHACVASGDTSNSSTFYPTPIIPEENIEPCPVPEGYIAEVPLGGYCFFEVDGNAYPLKLTYVLGMDDSPIYYWVEVGKVGISAYPKKRFTIGFWTGNLVFDGEEDASNTKVKVRLKR